MRGEVGMGAGVGDLVDALHAEGRGCGQAAAGELGLAQAEAALDADAVQSGEGDSRDRCVADLGGHLGEVIERRVGRCVEDLISIEGLDALGVAARDFSFWQGGVHVTPIRVGDACLQ